MRIVSWNCNGAFRNKTDLVDELKPDVVVIQECENPNLVKFGDKKSWMHSHIWSGGNKNKGLCIFSNAGNKIVPVDVDHNGLQSFIPFKLNDLSGLAVWTKEAKSPTFKYIGQLYKWINLHGSLLDTEKSMVIGDFNGNSQWDLWDRWWNHSDVVRALENKGLQSLYHRKTGQLQGTERDPTFFLHRNPAKPYHIDYVFLSQKLIDDAHIEIGNRDHWLKYSDHLPLIVDFTP